MTTPNNANENQINEYAKKCRNNSSIKQELYLEYKVNRGLRDLQGNGVLTGLTEISEIKSKELSDGQSHPCIGELFYRGYNVKNLISGLEKNTCFGFEEISYLLLVGDLPSKDEFADFVDVLSSYRKVSESFTRDIIFKATSGSIMNTISRCVLSLYAYDERPDDISLSNVFRQCLQMIAVFPLLSIYAYQALNFRKNKNASLFIHNPDPKLSTSENILMMLRDDRSFTEMEAKLLDILLILHAEHGGGNNSSFTTHVVSSSGTDTYSAIAAALCSLKGPKHGGANIKVYEMFEDMKNTISDWLDENEIEDYLSRLLSKEAFDHSGLIYGIGHAVYSLSDPRVDVLKTFVEPLALEKGREKELRLYQAVERIAPRLIAGKRTMYKGVSANIDFYSGLVYQLLNIPTELFTPLFAVSRIAGWSAHRMEELINCNKIIRPDYKAVGERRIYRAMKER